MQNVAGTSNKRSMKNDRNPATAHHTITTARRPDNIRSFILVRGQSIWSMARSGRQPRKQLPRKDSHFCHFGGLFDSVESVGHIQRYCPVLQLPRIAIHHGIWRELMFSIRKPSTELNDTMELRWHFLPTLSREAHAE